MQTTIQIDGKPIRLDLHEPRSGAAVKPAILLLHGAGGNTEYWLEPLTPLLAQSGIAAFGLHYFDRTGTIHADMQTLADGVHVPLWLSTIQHALAHITARPEIDPNRIALVGISLGAFLSLAVATLPGTAPIRAIVEVSGGLVPPYDANASSDFPPTLILHGNIDTVVSVTNARALDARLTQLGVPHEMHLFPTEGHWFSEAAQARILAHTAAFLARHL